MKALIIAILLTVSCFGIAAAVDLGGDITPPVFVEHDGSKPDNRYCVGCATITLSVQMTDDLSGVDYFQIGFINKFGYNQKRNCDTWIRNNRGDRHACAMSDNVSPIFCGGPLAAG